VGAYGVKTGAAGQFPANIWAIWAPERFGFAALKPADEEI